MTNVGNDRAQLAPMARAAQQTLGAENLHVIADRGYFDGEQVKECVDAGLTVTLPKPQTSGAKAASASRTSSTCATRTTTDVRPAPC